MLIFNPFAKTIILHLFSLLLTTLGRRPSLVSPERKKKYIYIRYLVNELKIEWQLVKIVFDAVLQII